MKTQRKRQACSAVLLSLGFSLTAWSQTAIPINNPSFEEPEIDAAGDFTTSVQGWTTIGGPGAIGTAYPTATDFSAGAPDGNNIAFISANNDGDGIAQVLTAPNATLQPGAQYTLAVEVGNSGTFDFEGYRVQLLAGGVLLAEDNNTQLPGNGAFVTSTVTYTYDATEHEAVLGEPLEIRLLSRAGGLGETSFDDVRLSVVFIDPVAIPGGPYTVAPGGELALDGSASLPSGEATIVSYEWDLTNNGEFDDASGATPDAITYLELQNSLGLELGDNTIQLRVTDSDDNVAVASTIVTLVTAVPTPGFDLFFDAAFADDENEFWNDLVPNNPSGLGLRVDKSSGNVVTRQEVTDSDALLTHAFLFPGGGTNNRGALLVNTETTTTRSLANVGWNNQPVTLEMWIRPDNLTPTPSNGQILFETGGGTGLGLFLANNQVIIRKAGGSTGAAAYNISTDSNGVLTAPATDEFFQVVGTYNNANGALQLFINGELVATGTAAPGNWDGGDAGAFATRGGNNTGGLGNGQQNTESFAGEIALIRAYRDRILTATEVEDNFNAIFLDTTPPETVAFDPAPEATGIYPGIGELTVTFNERIQLTTLGSITIKNLTAGTEQVISLPDAAVSLVDSFTVSIALPANLAFDSEFAVRISDDVVADLAGNPFAGINDDTTWSFTTVEENLTPPVITARTPEHLATGVPIGQTLVVTFDQNLILGTGDIVLKDLNDDATTMTMSVTDASQVALVDNVLTISPAGGFTGGLSYAVLIPSTAVRNFSEVPFAGITSDSEWTFSIANLVGQLGILDLTANDGINPATMQPWVAGDRYRLVFASSGRLDARQTTSEFGSWNDIATWNAEVQKFANNATGHDLSGATWRIIGSTTTVNARDNTATNSAVHGSGHPIMLIDGATIVAGDFSELWGPAGTQLRNIINRTENQGQLVTDIEGYTQFPVTGTNITGVGISGGQLRDISSSGSIRQGQLNERLGWIDRANFTVSALSNNPMPVYGMSDPLFVIDLDDDIAPELVSISDNVPGGSVALDQNPVITYTVTFSEAMLPSTVTATDFGNAGSAGFTINSVVQQEDAAVFLVTVTPTSEGTLQLQINESAVLTDLNGNPLDTSLALLDNTIIEVQASAVGYAAWAAGFTGLTNTDPTLDFDGGGLATALEWVFGGDPTNPSDDAGLVPTIDNASDPDGKLLFTFRRNIDAENDPDTTIVVEYSTDLVGWTAAAHEGAGAEEITISVDPDGFGPGIDAVTAALPSTLAAGGRLFVRLNVEVEQPPAE